MYVRLCCVIQDSKTDQSFYVSIYVIDMMIVLIWFEYCEGEGGTSSLLNSNH